MGDVAEKRLGNRIYRVYGLQTRAEAIRSAAGRVSDAISAILDGARTALTEFRGPHAEVFAERVNEVAASLVALQLAGTDAAAMCSWFPAQPASSSIAADYAYRGARVYAPQSGGALSADADALHSFARLAGDQSGAFTGLAAAVTTSGLWADVSVLRGLNSAERERWEAQGVPGFEIATAQVWDDPYPVAVSEVFDLPDLSGQAGLAAAGADELAGWVAAVAFALEQADQVLLALLMEHPELAVYLDESELTGGTMTGETALLVVLAHLDMIEVRGNDPDADGIVGRSDLEDVAGDEDLPEYVRAAAQYLLDNPVFTSMASIVDVPTAYQFRPDEVHLTGDGIELFLQYNAALRAAGLGFDRLDAAGDDETDGEVSWDNLEAAAGDDGLPESLQEAAAFLVANPMLVQRLQFYENANFNRALPGSMLSEVSLTNDSGATFTRNGLIALAIDQQAYASDPAAANQFVNSLPVADERGDGGLPLMLTTDEGVIALANAALADVTGDLSGQHAVIAHLPETTSWSGDAAGLENQHGGVRNQLITGFYDLMAHRGDALFAGDLAGFPDVGGHPGASWMQFAPWASDTVGGVITGETTGPLGITTSGVMQAAADGNQWIFNDIGARYAAFIELYEQSPNPSEAELEHFFASTFDEGDGTIRNGFVAYVAALEADDPVTAQRLMFEGNVLIATHEQAGAQIYLERTSPGPDNITVNWVDAEVAGEMLDMNEDLPAGPTVNNHVISAPIVSMDPAGSGPEDFPADMAFSVDDTPSNGVVDLEPIAGVELHRPEFSTSTTDWIVDGGGDPANPDSLAGSGASSWPDWSERMHAILRLFEQNHTNPKLFDTPADIELGEITWLDAAVVPQ